MKTRDVVVRIIQPAEQPKPAQKASAPIAENKREKLLHRAANILGLAGIFALAIFVIVNFFHLGISANDLAIIVGIPLSLGIVTSYAVF